MNKFVSMNKWNFSGKIIYIKELEKDFGASLKIRGTASRKDNIFSQPCEVGCLLTKEAYEAAKRKGIDLYKYIAVTGHLESIAKGNKNPKLMFIAENIMEVS